MSIHINLVFKTPLNAKLVGGWAYPSQKYEFVSCDDDIPNWIEKIIQMFQTTNQQ